MYLVKMEKTQIFSGVACAVVTFSVYEIWRNASLVCMSRVCHVIRVARKQAIGVAIEIELEGSCEQQKQVSWLLVKLIKQASTTECQ